MQIKGPDTPNHKNKYSSGFPMLWNHEIDTKFAFLAHLVQKLSPSYVLIGANIEAAILDFQQKIGEVVHIGCVPTGS